ncbi:MULTISPECIES: DNA-binding protein [unclassified Streptomyces]|uniref:DNA-binding protein n=1 Tax=unclassified Streptomyces TaxID=2593676 RepID=UPI001F0479D9|nr:MULTISPECIES: DNA-binding protein [unclassified Streptomyces]MCH0565909.1 DNA-binding protein [Streptomyces sp. MUM 2J]MCH0569074.1 DNA-binding protein [Streptomyces sp. MUM 136J]
MSNHSTTQAATTARAALDPEELLAAGAVLPPGTEGAGARAVELTARAYRHPGLADRTVVRLVPGPLGAAEDLAAGFLGMQPYRQPEVVGLGARQALGFPEWVLVHHPQDGHRALDLVPELERAAQRAKTKPKAALDACRKLADRLAGSVPHFLPTFYEQAGRIFLGVDNTGFAGRMFTAARKAEAEHGLAVDEERLDAVFLEFALAGALPVKSLSGYAKDLAARVPGEEALRRYVRLCVRRTSGGLPPSAQMAADVRRLAKAAPGQRAGEAEQEYVAQLLGLAGTLRAAHGWWKAHRAALVALARRDARVRGMLLNSVPHSDDDGLSALWLEMLEESGATAGLCDDDVPAEARPADGSAGWLERFLDFRRHRWDQPDRMPELYALVERMAPRLRRELAERGTPLSYTDEVDLLDLLLSLDVPVADPGGRALRLNQWALGEGQRDLLALAADPRFRPPFRRSADSCSGNAADRRTVRLLAASPGGRPMLTDWVREVAGRSTAAGLPRLPAALARLSWLPGEALALAPDEVRQAAARGRVDDLLARTLRGGILDELSWPAWEEAAATLVRKEDVDDLIVAEAWPHLIVASRTQARVIGPEGTVLTHDLRIPAGDNRGDPGFHFVDGELLVHWTSRALDGALRGYWHTSPGRLQPLEGPDSPRGTRMNYYSGFTEFSLPLPGGGRATGGGVLHRGDTALPAERPVISDGTSYWVWRPDGNDAVKRGWASGASWYEYDPATGEHGRRGMPGFLADALRTAPEGSRLRTGRLLPAPAGAGAPAGGLLGWREVRLPDGSQRGTDPEGRAVTVPSGCGRPAGAVLFPGHDRPCAVTRGSYAVSLVDPDGVVTAAADTDDPPGPFGAGTLILPPVEYWHCLRPRDPEGSAVLRRVGRETAAALLDAAAGHEGKELQDAVRALLPGIAHEALVAGAAGVVRYAAKQQTALDDVAHRLAEALTVTPSEDEPAGPSDAQLQQALAGLVGGSYHRYGDGTSDRVFRRVRAVARAARRAQDTPAAAASGGRPAVRLHLDGPPLPDRGRPDLLPFTDRCAAVAFRAAAPATEPEHRETLLTLLRELDSAGLSSAAEPVAWRRFRLHVDGSLLTPYAGKRRDGNWSGVLPLDGGACIAVVNWSGTPDEKDGCDFTALFHDPSGRFEVPAPYTVRSSEPVGEPGRDADWVRGFLTELAERGPAPWLPAAAEEFARLTGATAATARLVLAGLPGVDEYGRSFLSKEVRTAIGVKVADAALAKDMLRRLDPGFRRAVVSALLPAEPARLWAEGPDVTAAARVWNARVGRRAAIPEELLGDAVRMVRVPWEPAEALPALLDPAAEPRLGRDLRWQIRGDRARQVDAEATGFDSRILVSTVALTAWLAHRLPEGDPIRTALAGALGAVRDRLAHPELLLDLDRFIDLPRFRAAAGAPTETGDGWERYGAVVLATHDDQPAPAIRTALLDGAGGDPYLPALRTGTQAPFPTEVALRLALDPSFEALLTGPGDPEAGGRAEDGTWWPQDPGRSVPGLVGEVAGAYGLGRDAATLYLVLLAMPDPTDRNTARWTGWRPARLRAARAELAGHGGLVGEARRSRAGRSLFLPGGWTVLRAPRTPLEQWKLPLYGALLSDEETPLDVVVPVEPAAELFRRAWQRVQDGDVPRFEELKVPRGGRR